MTVIAASWLKGPARQVCEILVAAGHQAWFVGGCVRNAIISAPVADLDLCTDARPDVVMTLAQAAGLKAIPTGIDHGTITVVVEGVTVEVTTFRRDVTTDGRRAIVTFADTMIEDARRRDFTMNALYCDKNGVVVDPLGGLPDLIERRVRFIDDAEQRVQEDYLRILRFFRFHAWYGDVDGGIDADGLAACAENIDGLAGLSRERVTSEMLKLLSAPNPAPAVASMGAAGVLHAILAGATPDVLAVLVHLEEQAGLEPDPIRRLVALGGQRDRLKLTNAEARKISLLTNSEGMLAFAFHHGASLAIDRAATEAASLGQTLNPELVAQINFAATQILPVSAADFMPRLEGAALGAALRKAEADWIQSNFTLTKADLRRE